MNFIKISIASLNKKSLKDIGNIINNAILRLLSYFNNIKWYSGTFDNIKSELFELDLSKTSR